MFLFKYYFTFKISNIIYNSNQKILSYWIYKNVFIYNGKIFINLWITEKMINFFFKDFVFFKKFGKKIHKTDKVIKSNKKLEKNKKQK